jgi:putative MATE family efflux protein
MPENKMGYVPIPKLIPKMALPLIFSMLVQALYNVVDSIFVSRISEGALTALSLAMPVQMVVVAAFVGLSVGVSSAISRKLGAKDHEGAVLVAENNVIISIILYCGIALFGIFGVQHIFGAMTDDPQIIEYTITYLRIILLFSFGSMLNQSGRSIFRGTGDMIKPMIAQLIGAILNIILDPILIFGYLGFPAMGVKGAAIATVTAQIVAMIYIWVQLLMGKSIIKIKIKRIAINMPIIRDILHVGFPSFVMQSLGSVMIFCMNFILSRFGDSAIAVMGVYFRVQSLVFMPVFALSSSTMPVVGFNYGAQNRKRMKDAVRFSSIAAVIFMTLCFVVFQTIPRQLLSLFNASQELLSIGIPAIRTISLSFPVVGMTIVMSTAFQGLGKAFYSLAISLVRMLIILLPSAFLLASFNNVDLVWYAFVIAELSGVIMTVILFVRTFRKSTEGWPEVEV